VLLISAVLIQTTLSPYIQINGVHPDLVLLLVIGWTVLRGLEEGILWALVGGLSIDFISGTAFGLFTLALLLTTLAAGLFHGRIFGSSIVLPLGLAFPLSLFFNSIALFLLSLLGHPVVWLDALSNLLFPLALFNTGVMTIVFPLLYLLNRFLYPQQLSF